METKQTVMNYPSDVSNKIVGKDEVERLIADYGHLYQPVDQRCEYAPDRLG